MKIIVTSTSFEGTLDEYKVWREMEKHGLLAGQLEDRGHETDTVVERESLVEFAKSVLNRRAVSKTQRKLFEVLYEAGEDGLLSSDMATKIGVTRAELAGVLGAFGRRVHNTRGAKEPEKLGREGLRGAALLFDMTWVDGKRHYRMLPELRAALESLSLV